MTVDTLSKLPVPAQKLWEATYSSAKNTHNEEQASRIAWVNVRSKFNKVSENWVARTDDLLGFSTSKFIFNADEATIARSDNFTTVNYVLATSKSIGGVSLSPIALKRMAEQINLEGLKGRKDSDGKHGLLDKLRHDDEDDDEEDIEHKLQSVDSGITADSAYVKDDKLIARVKFANGVTPAKAVSIEARFPTECLRAGVTDQARAMGFVLTDSPADPDAVAV
jgi:hypothetical protein